MVIYSKYSNERRDGLNIRTDILEEDGRRFVRKSPLDPLSEKHIESLYESGQLLRDLYQKQGVSFEPNQCTKHGNALDYEYIDGQTLTNRLDHYLTVNQKRTVTLLDEYVKELEKLEDSVYEETEDFRRIFGSVPDVIRGKGAVSVPNIDMIPDNIIYDAAGKPIVIDYEWTFRFPVPTRFIIWRMLHYFIHTDVKRQWLSDIQYIEKQGFTGEELDAYGKMEEQFQSYVRGDATCLQTLYPAMSPGTIGIENLRDYASEHGGSVWTTAIDYGNGFEDSTRNILPYEHISRGKTVLPLKRDVRGVRVELGNDPCILKITEISTSMGYIFADELKSNGRVLNDSLILFSNHDPWFEVSGWKSGATSLTINFERFKVDPEAMNGIVTEMLSSDQTISRLEGERSRLEDLIRIRTDITSSFMKTKGLKSYRYLRRKSKKTDPYQLLYPELQNDPNQTYLHVEEVLYKKDACMIRGWAADRDLYRDTVTVVDENWNQIDAEVYRLKRGDVAQELGLNPDLLYGFAIYLKYPNIPSQGRLFVSVENARGFLRNEAVVERDEQKRQELILRDVDAEYDSWFRWHRPDEKELQRQREDHFDQAYTFSIVIPLYKTPEDMLRQLVDSVIDQTYGNWELVLSDGSGSDSPIEGLLDELAAKDSRIKIVKNNRQLYIADNTNEAIKAATGDFIAFCDHDDLLAPDALYENAAAIRRNPDLQVLYSDEDKINDQHEYIEPHFKPDFNQDLLNSQNYICHFFVAKREIIDQVGMLNGEYDGSQDHDFILRCTEAAEHIEHIPKILYHWRLSEGSTAQNPYSKMYCYENGRRAVQAHWDRLGIPAVVEREPNLGYYRTRYHWGKTPLVSALIPNKDQSRVLKRCIDSIVGRSAYRNFEIIIVENNSAEEETFRYYEELKSELKDQVKIVTYEGDFNYSAINNLGAKEAKGEYILLLNNDTEMIYPDVMEEMLNPCMRDDVGAVGAKLYFENDTIQHAGVIVGFGGVAGHRFLGQGRTDVGYMFRNTVVQDLSAVTAAAMMVKRSVFEQVQGFTEELPVAYNDVDLCMKIGEAGYRIVYNPHAELYHYESLSRGYEDTPEKKERLQRESDEFASRWPEILKNGDPHYNPNCSAVNPAYALRKMSEYDHE